MSKKIDSYWCLPLAVNQHREVSGRFPEIDKGEDFIRRGDAVAGIVKVSNLKLSRRLPVSAGINGRLTVAMTKFLVGAFGGQVEAEGIASKERTEEVLREGNVIAISVKPDHGSHAEYIFPGGKLSFDHEPEPGFVDSLADRVARTVREGHSNVNLLRIKWSER